MVCNGQWKPSIESKACKNNDLKDQNSVQKKGKAKEKSQTLRERNDLNAIMCMDVWAVWVVCVFMDAVSGRNHCKSEYICANTHCVCVYSQR